MEFCYNTIYNRLCRNYAVVKQAMLEAMRPETNPSQPLRCQELQTTAELARRFAVATLRQWKQQGGFDARRRGRVYTVEFLNHTGPFHSAPLVCVTVFSANQLQESKTTQRRPAG